jgi:hypothetical protein
MLGKEDVEIHNPRQRTDGGCVTDFLDVVVKLELSWVWT